MLVSERDLFNFVFWKEGLSTEKIEYIINNFLNYKEKIQFLQKLFEEFNSEIPPKIWDALIKKLNVSYKKKIHFLNKVKNETNPNNNEFILAAQSPKEEKHFQVDTFIDQNSSFLIKILTDKNKNKIFLFADESVGNKEFELKIYPSGRIVNIFNNSSPIIIEPKETINNISITELNLEL